jgi:hypothetical protein
MLGSKGIYIGLEEGKSEGVGQSGMNEGEKVPGHGVSKQVSEGEGLGGE